MQAVLSSITDGIAADHQKQVIYKGQILEVSHDFPWLRRQVLSKILDICIELAHCCQRQLLPGRAYEAAGLFQRRCKMQRRQPLPLGLALGRSILCIQAISAGT
jgi:hypothetical protein